ncbi:MAG: 3-methyl-2-oxobutanoate hydroxymethyltransferase [Rhodospirillales bacterium]|nr:3-methyl-2-oxobutanoate hydroxymethyltransferase [Rhodospirillales bacterium]
MAVSVHKQWKKVTVPQIRESKGGEPIICLTAYTSLTAVLLDEHVDLLLVGDSLGMVLYGMDSTLGVSLDMMIGHGKAVMRGARKSCVIVDMPFGSYQESPESAFRNAARVMKEVGCAGVKLEGGVEMAETIRFLVQRGIPVLGHIGLLPQSVNTAGGFRSLGRKDKEAAGIIEDAKAVEEAGAFATVIEGTVEPLAREITEMLSIPTIGIGASPACDGQILVTEDLVGLFSGFKPKFVKRYAELGAAIEKAVEEYAGDVRARRFPTLEQCFGVKAPESEAKTDESKSEAPETKPEPVDTTVIPMGLRSTSFGK